MAMIIEVTAEDIANGKKSSITDCPVALALHRAGFPTATVGAWSMMNGEGFDALPEGVSQFIARFDGGEPVEPFSFEVPWEVAAPKKIAKKKTAKKKTAKKKAAKKTAPKKRG